VTLLRKGLLYYPKDFWLHFQLGFMLKNPAERVVCFRAALAIRPDSPAAHNNLALALQDLKDYDGAIAHYEKAAASNRTSAATFNNWGTVLGTFKDWHGAAAKYQLALDLDPKFAAAYVNLGHILVRKGDPDGAIQLYKKALDLYAQSWDQFGWYYYKKRMADLHFSLGLALYAKKDYAEASAEHRMSLTINPKYADAHGGLGQALLKQGNFAEAKKATLQFVQLLPPGHHLKSFAQKQLQECMQVLALDEKLAEVLKDKLHPPDAAACLSLARLCHLYKQHYATAARFYADAFAADPSLAAQFPERYVAARAAVLAGTGKGKDVDKLDEPARAKLRQQALDWLQADLAARTKQFQSGAVKSIVAVAKTMTFWQIEPDLAGVRDEPALAKLPKAEQEAWHHLWADVGKLSKQAQSTFTETKMQGTLTAAKREQVYPLKLAAGKTYVFELESKLFEPFLRLEDTQGKLLATDARSGSNLNARIVFAVAKDDTYRLVATSLQKETGAYTLMIWEFPGK
jgi:Tfp pilus assembly protein PilF